MPGVAAPIVHTGIVLTVSGVSRCVSLDAYAAASIVPLLGGTGLAIAFEAPIVAEACGLGSIAAVEDVEVKVVGRGLHYSTPGLGDALGEIAARLYSEGDSALAFDEIGVNTVGYRYPLEAAAASVAGSSALVGGHRFPLNELQGYWAVVVRLEKPLRPLAEYWLAGIASDPVEDVLAALDEGVEAVRRVGLRSARSGGRRALALVKRALRAGAEAAVLDVSGRLLVALADGAEAAATVSARLRGLGDRFEGLVVV